MKPLEACIANLREKIRLDVSEDEFNISVMELTESALVAYTETLRAKAAKVYEAMKAGKSRELMLDLKNDIDSHY